MEGHVLPMLAVSLGEVVVAHGCFEKLQQYEARSRVGLE